MAKYKATGDIKNKEVYLKIFHSLRKNIEVEKIRSLLEGEEIDISGFNALPKSVKDHLEPIDKKQKKEKGDK